VKLLYFFNLSSLKSLQKQRRFLKVLYLNHFLKVLECVLTTVVSKCLRFKVTFLWSCSVIDKMCQICIFKSHLCRHAYNISTVFCYINSTWKL